MEIAKEIYNLELKVKIIEAQNDIAGGTAGPIDLAAGLKSVVVKYRLDFDNRDYVKTCKFLGESENLLNNFQFSSFDVSQMHTPPLRLNVRAKFVQFHPTCHLNL